MGTQTTNYSLEKPTIGGDGDSWGDESPGTGLNENMNIIDLAMKAISDIADGAVQADGSVAMTAKLSITQSVAGEGISLTHVADTWLLGADDTSDSLNVAFGGVDTAAFDVVGTAAPTVLTVMTREKGDDRYAQLSGTAFTGDVSIATDLAVTGETEVQNHGSTTDYSIKILNSTDVDGSFSAIRGLAGGHPAVYTAPAGVPLEAARFDDVGPATTHDRSVITRQKGDARYVQQTDAVWGNFNGSTGATLKAVGLTCAAPASALYSVVFDTAQADANYGVLLTPTTSAATTISHGMVYNKTTTGFDVYFYSNTSVRTAPLSFTVQVLS